MTLERLSEPSVISLLIVIILLSGFLPTYGPSWMNLYGSKREYNTVDKTRKLNEGFGEGCMYRGRVLLSLKTEVQDGSLETGGIRVDVEPTLPISEVCIEFVQN